MWTSDWGGGQTVVPTERWRCHPQSHTAICTQNCQIKGQIFGLHYFEAEDPKRRLDEKTNKVSCNKQAEIHSNYAGDENREHKLRQIQKTKEKVQKTEQNNKLGIEETTDRNKHTGAGSRNRRTEKRQRETQIYKHKGDTVERQAKLVIRPGKQTKTGCNNRNLTRKPKTGSNWTQNQSLTVCCSSRLLLQFHFYSGNFLIHKNCNDSKATRTTHQENNSNTNEIQHMYKMCVFKSQNAFSDTYFFTWCCFSVFCR